MDLFISGKEVTYRKRSEDQSMLCSFFAIENLSGFSVPKSLKDLQCGLGADIFYTMILARERLEKLSVLIKKEGALSFVVVNEMTTASIFMDYCFPEFTDSHECIEKDEVYPVIAVFGTTNENGDAIGHTILFLCYKGEIHVLDSAKEKRLVFNSYKNLKNYYSNSKFLAFGYFCGSKDTTSILSLDLEYFPHLNKD